MKPKLQDYLLIAAALLAIFVSGYGIGYLFGEYRTTNRLRPATLENPASSPWEQRTLKKLTDRLQLDEAQQEQMAQEIEKTSDVLNALRSDTVKESQRAILDLQMRMEGFLDDRQRRLIRRDREELEKALDPAAVQE